MTACDSQSNPPATALTASTSRPKETGERVPSEDPQIKDFHSLGLIQGRTTIFRSASPTRDLVKNNPIPEDLAPLKTLAQARLRHLHDLGIRTIISFENPDTQKPDPEAAAGAAQRALWIDLEKQAAQDAGITFLSRPINNSGPDSLETMADNQVYRLIDPISEEILRDAQAGGVLFHCAAGHDRTGLVAAYIRIKYEQWPADQAIDEMRRYGHNWIRYSNNGGTSSWHEDHLRAIASLLKPQPH